jgi:hypothetical protein
MQTLNCPKCKTSERVVADGPGFTCRQCHTFFVEGDYKPVDDEVRWTVIWREGRTMKCYGAFLTERDAQIYFGGVPHARKWIIPLPWSK